MFYFGTNTKQQLNKELHEEVVEIASLLAKSNKKAQLFVLPTMPLLVPLKKMSFGSGLWIGPQKISGLDQNTTGEVAATLVKELDADLVMVGHAERRALGEGEKELSDQITQCQANDLKMIYCMGEKKKENNIKNRKKVFQDQLRVLKDLHITWALIGYEPVWSIGIKGTPASSTYIKESFQIIHEVLVEFELNPNDFPLCYGGSVNIDNVKEIASLELCDGIFVGRSAWSKEGFRNVFEKAFSGYKSNQNAAT